MATATLSEHLQTALGDAYVIVRELPHGGMSRLVLAREVGLDRLVVVKALPPEHCHGACSVCFDVELPS